MFYVAPIIIRENTEVYKCTVQICKLQIAQFAILKFGFTNLSYYFCITI